MLGREVLSTMVTRIRRARFEALAMWCRSPGTRAALRDCDFFSVDGERIIGTTYYFKEKDCFAYVLMARDKFGRYQVFSNKGIFRSARAAGLAIQAELLALATAATPTVPMRTDTRPGIDLFAEIPGVRCNPKFVNLRDGRNPAAARDLLREVARWFVDLDGNFVRDFQSTGFDARIWELFLFAALTSLDFGFDRSDAVPDFRLLKGNTKIFVEAVTANPTGGVEIDITGPPPPPPENFWDYLEHQMPQKFGSPLLSKVRKRYWERTDMVGHPFVIALADFHAPASMVWSHTALPFYLYGMGVEVHERKDGSIYGTKKKLADHVVSGKVVPTNFFSQDENRHISAILFSNAGTAAKFNRMGVLAGLGDPDVTLVRSGKLNDPSPNAFEGIPFNINVEDPDYSEAWADEIEIYHNPNAVVPLSHELFDGTTHFFLEKGELVWRGPSPRVLASTTVSRAPKRGEA